MHSDSRVLTYSDECFVNLFSKFAAVLSNKICFLELVLEKNFIVFEGFTPFDLYLLSEATIDYA
jgi:hypothetical protein